MLTHNSGHENPCSPDESPASLRFPPAGSIPAMTMPLVMTLVMVFVAAFVMAFAMPFVMFIVGTAMLVMPPMFTPVGFLVFPFVPVFMYKIDLAIARIVTVAMLAPIAGMAGRHAQIQWRQHFTLTHDNDWLAINDLWRGGIADINLAIKAGLADLYRDGNIASAYRHGDGQ